MVDISRAYLQSKDSWRKIYILPPTGAIENQTTGIGKRTVWRAVKPIYGLCDATKGWYETLSEYLKKECGAVVSAVDPAMFYWTGHGKNEVYKKTWSKTWEEVENSKLPPEVIDEIPDAQVFGVMTCHVDDLTMYGEREFLEWLTEMVQKKFVCKPPEKNDSVVCGLGMKRELLKDKKVILRTSSRGYEDRIKEVVMGPEAQLDKNRLLTPEEVAAFQKQLGMLLWLVRLTRADLGFEAASASQKIVGDQEFLQEYEITDVSRTNETEE